MNNNESSAETLLKEIKYVSTVYENEGLNGLEEGAKFSNEISDILAGVNSGLSSGWSTLATTFLSFNEAAKDFINGVYTALVNYCNDVITSENVEIKAVEETSQASKQAVQQVEDLFN